MTNSFIFYAILVYLNIINLIVEIYFLKNFLHSFQLKNYSPSRYLCSMKRVIPIPFIYLVLLLLALIFRDYYFSILLNLIVFIISVITNSKHKSEKTPLVFTSRIKNLFSISLVILFPFIFLKCGIIFSNLLLFFVPVIANSLNFVDIIKNKKFIKLAQLKLNNYKPKIIAITGSNGKTSVKNILLKLLNRKYLVQATPSSYNTPLGISKFINEKLEAKTQILILEFGARKNGDIKKLCEIFGVDLGIVTSVFPQHLETFKTIENVYKTKKELPDFLKNKPCFFNLNNPYVKTMFKEKAGERYGVFCDRSCQLAYENINVNFSDIERNQDNIISGTDYETNEFNTEFVINFDKENIFVSTKLLGKHNIINILLASATAKYLGLSNEEIKHGIESLEQVPHRLQFIKSSFNIIDDSYNCSIASAQYALDFMNSIAGKKMIATPGIIEGGKQEYAINFELGKMLTDFDYVVIIGNHNKRALTEGINYAQKTLKSQIFYINTLNEIYYLYTKLKANDTLLFLNDLPDDYD